MAARHGYKVETHRVTTEDGYVLSMHRIPRGRESNRGGTIPIPKNCDSDSLAHFGGIGTGIVNKGIVKRIEKESFSDSQFLITGTGGRN